jgi:hypothetical protein
MSLSEVHYLPLAPPFFFILVGLFVALLVLIQLGVLRYAYMRLGISSGPAGTASCWPSSCHLAELLVLEGLDIAITGTEKLSVCDAGNVGS